MIDKDSSGKYLPDGIDLLASNSARTFNASSQNTSRLSVQLLKLRRDLQNHKTNGMH